MTKSSFHLIMKGTFFVCVQISPIFVKELDTK